MGRPKKNLTQETVVEKEKTILTETVEETTAPDEETFVEETTVTKNTETTTEPTKSAEINDDEEIEVVSLDSNVSYWDKSTDETYVWDNVGEIVVMPYFIIKNMWRNHKTYFRNFILKPLDDRVIKKLGLIKTYEKYEFLTDGSQYTKKNIDTILKTLNSGTSSFKSAICNNIKNLITNGEITDVHVIMTLSKQLDIDFISLIN